MRDCVKSRRFRHGRNHIVFVGDSRARQLFCTATRLFNDALVQTPKLSLSPYAKLSLVQHLNQSREPTTRTFFKSLGRRALPRTRCRRYGRLHPDSERSSAPSALQVCDDLDAMLNLEVVSDASELPCADVEHLDSTAPVPPESVLVESSVAVDPAASAHLQSVPLSPFDVETLWNTYAIAFVAYSILNSVLCSPHSHSHSLSHSQVSVSTHRSPLWRYGRRRFHGSPANVSVVLLILCSQEFRTIFHITFSASGIHVRASAERDARRPLRQVEWPAGAREALSRCARNRTRKLLLHAYHEICSVYRQ